MLNVIKAFLATVLAIFVCNLSSYAMVPEEYCNIHEESKAPGTCTVRGDCVVFTTNLGTEECKLCSDGGCELLDNCDGCPVEAKQADKK